MRVRQLAALLPLLAACSPDPLPPTQVIVVVGSDLPLHAISVVVASDNGRNASAVRFVELEAMRGTGRTLPTSFTIVPARVEPAETFRVLVTGAVMQQEDASTPVVRAIATARFESQRTIMLPVALSKACQVAGGASEDACGCAWGIDSCEETCLPPGYEQEAGCVPVPQHATLAEVEPGGEIEALLEGAAPCEVGEVLDPSGKCIDLDECSFDLDHCDSEPDACDNSLSGADAYVCRCPPGYEGDGVGELGCRRSG